MTDAEAAQVAEIKIQALAGLIEHGLPPCYSDAADWLLDFRMGFPWANFLGRQKVIDAMRRHQDFPILERQFRAIYPDVAGFGLYLELPKGA